MTNRELIYESTAIIEDHLKKPLDISSLAEKIGYSLYHFTRLFHGVTGSTPGEYVAARRLYRSAVELLDNTGRIIDIAFDYQYTSPEAYSRAFKKYSGMSPRTFRSKAKIFPNLASLPWASPFHKIDDPALKEKNARDPEIVEYGDFLLGGHSVEIQNNFEPIMRLWQRVMQITPPSYAQQPTAYAQCAYWDTELPKDSMYIMAGFLMDTMGSGDSLSYKKIPAARYLRFPHYGPGHRVSETYMRLFSEWLPNSNHRLPLAYNMELYPDPESDAAKKGISVWILLPLEVL